MILTDMRRVLSEARRQDLIDSILMYNEEYADNVGISSIGPTQKELQSFTDAELEQELEFAKSSYEGSMSHDMTDVDDDLDTSPALAQEPVHSPEDHPAGNLPSKMGMGRRHEGLQGIPDSITRIIVAEGAALKTAGLLEEFELNYNAIEEAIHEETLFEGLGDDVYLPRRELLDLIAAMEPEEIAGGEYVDDDTGEVLLVRGQKAGSSYAHPDYKHVKRPVGHMDGPTWHDDELSVEDEYQDAIEAYAADFAGESYDDAEGIAADAAEGFFALNPKWKTWSSTLGLTKADIKSAVAELIHSQLMGEGLQLEAQHGGREVKLGKPMKGDVKKFKVYVNDKKTGNVKKVNFGDPNAEIKRDDPKRRKNFRARHGCGTKRASDRTKAAYWSCRMWSSKPVSKILKGK